MLLKKIKLKPSPISTIDFPDDVAKLVKIFADRGYDCSPDLAYTIWSTYSEDVYCAGWLIMKAYSDEELFNILFEYVEVENPTPSEP